MNSPARPEVSIIIVVHNSTDVLGQCLRSIANQRPESCEVIVADNASQADSHAIIQETYPTARFVWLSENLGYGAGCNAGAAIARGDYLAFLNPDTAVDPDWLRPLIAALAADPTVGAVTPKIVLMNDPGTINTCGNDVHFVGFPSCHRWGEKAAEVQEPAEVTSISGAAFVIERQLFQRLGGFDPRYFMYLEDTDLSWRLRLAGFRCRYIPQSVVRHRYAPAFSADKFFFLERNRHQLLLKNLAQKTLLALLPALVLAEISVWGYALLRGRKHVASKWRSYGWLLRHWKTLRSSRSSVRPSDRRISERELLRACSTRIAYDAAYGGQVAHGAAAILNPLYSLCRLLALSMLKADQQDC